MNMTRRCFLKLSGAAMVTIALPGGAYAAVRGIPVLMYHDLGISSTEYETVAPAQFASQMEWLSAEGYRAVSPAELAGFSPADADRVVLITADDGHASFLDYGYYLLREYGFKATVNVVARTVGGYVNENRPRLSWDECRFLQQSGLVEIGCHTYNLHDWDGSLPREAALAAFNGKLAEDLVRFQDVYKQKLGKSAEILAWPYGLYDRTSVEIAKKAGFRYFLNSDGGYVQRDADRYNIPRLTVNNTMDMEKFRSMIERRS